MPHVMVTGVAGFIGSHVAEHCLRQGFSVVGVDDLSGGFRENVPHGVEFRQGNVVDPDWVESLWDGKPYDYIYHLAAYAAEGLSHFIRRFNYENNLIGSVNLINQSILHHAKCFVFTSSIAVYGSCQTPMTEEMIPQPEDPYGISKYAVELDLRSAYHMFGLPYIIFRPHNVYGERQNCADKYRNVIGIFMNQALQGKAMTIFGDGKQTRAFTYIDDVAPIIARSPLVPNAYQQVFNIGSDTPFSVLELCEEVRRALGLKAKVVHLPPRKEVVHAFSSSQRLRTIFAPQTPVQISEGIRRMAKWFMARGSMTPTRFARVEVDTNLPSYWAKTDC